jgi:hypothetical protein
MKLYARGITNALVESEKTDRPRTKQHAIDPFFLHSQSFNLSIPEGPEVKYLRHASCGVAQFMREKALFWNAALGYRADLRP